MYHGPPLRSSMLAIAAVLLFAALLGLQYAARRFTTRHITLQDTYNELGQGLHAAGVLPLGSLGEMRAGLALLGAGELDAEAAAGAGAGNGAGTYAALAGAWRVFTSPSGVSWIEADPRSWRQLPRGAVSRALKRIAAQDFYAQSAAYKRQQGLRNLPVDFAFSIAVAGVEYVITPLFEDDKCVLLRITPPPPKI